MKSYIFYFFLVIVAATQFVFSEFAMGFVGLAKFKTDFTKGIIDFKPVLPVLKSEMIVYSKSSCIGFCFGGVEASKKNKDKTALDAYFYLIGDPDDLSIIFISYACSGPYLLSINHFYADMHVLQGSFSVKMTLAMNRQIIAGVLGGEYNILTKKFKGYEDYIRNEVPKNVDYPASKPSDYVNYACSNEYRTLYKYNRLSVLTDEQADFGNVFRVKYENDTVKIRWDTKQWKDKFEQELERTLLEGTHFLK